MLCHIERPLGFSTAFAAVKQVGVRGDADSVVNSDVAAERRGRVVSTDALGARRGAVNSRVDGTSEH